MEIQDNSHLKYSQPGERWRGWFPLSVALGVSLALPLPGGGGSAVSTVGEEFQPGRDTAGRYCRWPHPGRSGPPRAKKQRQHHLASVESECRWDYTRSSGFQSNLWVGILKGVPSGSQVFYSERILCLLLPGAVFWMHPNPVTQFLLTYSFLSGFPCHFTKFTLRASVCMCISR